MTDAPAGSIFAQPLRIGWRPGDGVTLDWEEAMIRLSSGAIVIGLALSLAACADVSSTAPGAVPSSAPAGNVSIAAAPLPSGSCTIAPNGAQYDVTVAWSDLSVTNIELRQINVAQPLVQAVLGHPTRKGSMTFTTSSIPDLALITGRQGGLTTRCVTPA